MRAETGEHGEDGWSLLSDWSRVPTSWDVVAPRLQILILFTLHLKPSQVSSGPDCPSDGRRESPACLCSGPPCNCHLRESALVQKVTNVQLGSIKLFLCFVREGGGLGG